MNCDDDTDVVVRRMDRFGLTDAMHVARSAAQREIWFQTAAAGKEVLMVRGDASDA